MPQVHFLPWAGITSATSIGPVTITPWTTIRKTIPTNARNFLDNYFTKYRTNNNQPVTDISIASITPNPLQDITDIERATIRRAVDALTFASTIPNLRTTIITSNHFGIPNSERFQLITQLLGNYTPMIAVSSRGTLQAWDINQIHFCIPWEVGSSSYQTDDELLNALGILLQGKKHKRLRERLFNTIEWFRLSQTGSSETSDASRLVMKATAYEVLLQPKDRYDKRRLMTQDLHALTNDKKLRNKSIKIGKKRYTVNAVAAFLNDFYELRNAIVHGDKITNKAFAYAVGTRQLPQLGIADLVLWEAITWELVKKKLVGKQGRQYANWLSKKFGKTRAAETLVRQVISSNLRIKDYHKALGWTK